MHQIEILVADGLSDDGTREIVQQLAAKESRVRLIDNPGRIVPTALNAALQQAKGDIIIRVDGHCEIASDYVCRCVKALQETNADNVGGPMRAVSENRAGAAIALATSSPFGVGNARFHYAKEPGWVDTVYLGAYRRQVFEWIGGFDEELVRNQDDEFNFRLIQAGGKIWLDPAIRSRYYSRATLPGLWRQYFQYGFYKVRLIQKRSAVPAWRHLVPVTFVLALLGSFLLALLTRRKKWTAAVAGPYLAANLAAALWVGRRRTRLIPYLPLVFATLHLSYGLGFLAGLIRFRRQWGKGETPIEPVIS